MFCKKNKNSYYGFLYFSLRKQVQVARFFCKKTVFLTPKAHFFKIL